MVMTSRSCISMGAVGKVAIWNVCSASLLLCLSLSCDFDLDFFPIFVYVSKGSNCSDYDPLHDLLNKFVQRDLFLVYKKLNGQVFHLA